MGAPVKNDGAIAFGSRTVQIPTTTGSTFVAESVSFDQPTEVYEQRDEQGDPDGQVIYNGFITGSMTLLLGSADTLPAVGDEFSTNIGGAAADCIVTSVGEAEGNADAKKVTVGIRKLLN